MGILRRLSDATRATLGDLKEARVKRSDKPLSELGDDELERELVRRRRARAQGTRGETSTRPREPEPPDDGSPQRKQILQYYANLELPPDASLEDVRKAYKDLMRRYHPDKHAEDPERHRAATELAQSLTNAYKALSEHLRNK